VLWGQLTDKNNPSTLNSKPSTLNPQPSTPDPDLFYFPGHFLTDGTYEQNTVRMDERTPYIEWRVGIHNIFKLIEIDYVRRITYRHNPHTNRWGIRFKVRMTF
jgi:hypothetical protein